MPSFRNQEVHLACGLLKGYIRDLREPIIPSEIIDNVLASVNLSNEEQLTTLKFELEKLPQPNRCVLYRLSVVRQIRVTLANFFSA